VTWQKSINPVRASLHERRAVESFKTGDLETAVAELDQAINLAPGVPNYHANRAQVFLAYRIRSDVGTQPDCDLQDENPYPVCLGLQSLKSNLDSTVYQPFNYRAWVATGNSAFNLQLHDLAVEYYGQAVSLVPNAWVLRDDLAESQIDAALYNEALAELDRSLNITGESSASARAEFLRGKALAGVGRLEEAADTLELGIQYGFALPWIQQSLDLRKEIHEKGKTLSDIDYFDERISQSPQDAIAIYLRGLAKIRLGNPNAASLDIISSYELGLTLPEVIAMRGYTRFKAGAPLDDLRDLDSAVLASPLDPLFQTYLGERLLAQDKLALALNHLDNANILDPHLGLAYLIRSKLFLSLGIEVSAKEALDDSIGFSLPNSKDYIDRGQLRTFFGDFDLAFSDLNEAIRISPNQAGYYNARGISYAKFDDYRSAINDFTVAIEKGDTIAEYLINRGVANDIIGETKFSSADFENAKSLENVEIPPPKNRNAAYFNR